VYFDDVVLSEIRSSELEEILAVRCNAYWQCSNWKNIENHGSVSGSAYIDNFSESLYLGTGTTANSKASFTKYFHWWTDWSTYRRILTVVVLIHDSTNQEIYFGTGYFPETSVTYDALAFKVVNGTMYAFASVSDSSKTEVNIGSVDTTKEHKYTIRFIPNDRAEFYVDDVLKAVITTNLPSGEEAIDEAFRAYIKNTADEDKGLEIFEVRVLIW